MRGSCSWENGAWSFVDWLFFVLIILTSANGYYSTFTYFSSKEGRIELICLAPRLTWGFQILFDIFPLRFVPPLIFGGIVYGLVGLVPTVAGFWKFLLTLVLFNMTTASVVLLLSIAFDSISVASLVGTLVMLFKCVYLEFELHFCS